MAVPGDADGDSDVFRFDAQTGTTVLVSVDLGSVGADGDVNRIAMDGSGNLIAFDSNESDLVASDTNSASDVFVRDITAATTTRVSKRSNGNQANGARELQRSSAEPIQQQAQVDRDRCEAHPRQTAVEHDAFALIERLADVEPSGVAKTAPAGGADHQEGADDRATKDEAGAPIAMCCCPDGPQREDGQDDLVGCGELCCHASNVCQVSLTVKDA